MTKSARRPSLISRLTLGLALVAGLAVAPAPADAAPSLREVLKFVGSTFNRLCNDAVISRFSRIDTSVKTRICHASVNAGRMVIEVRYRRAADDQVGYDREASGHLRQDISFNARSYFYCSAPRSDGFATLYMNCLGQTSQSSRRCAKTDWQMFSEEQGTQKESYRRSFANIIETSPENCGLMKKALNFIASRSRAYNPNAVSDFFAE